MTSFVARLPDGIDHVSRMVGSAVRWLTLFTVVVCVLVAFLRYAFSIGFVWMQEAYVWSHAIVFMLGAGYTYLLDSHVRVDLFHGGFSERAKAIVEIGGIILFLFPWLGVTAWFSWSFVAVSWRIQETSQQYAGLPALYLLKSVILIFVLLLALQGLSALLRNLMFLAGVVTSRRSPEKGIGPGMTT